VQILMNHFVEPYLPHSALVENAGVVGVPFFINSTIGPLEVKIVRMMHDADPDVHIDSSGKQRNVELYVDSPGIPALGAKVVKSDVESCVGVLHVVDMVLIPGAQETGDTDATASTAGTNASTSTSTTGTNATVSVAGTKDSSSPDGSDAPASPAGTNITTGKPGSSEPPAAGGQTAQLLQALHNLQAVRVETQRLAPIATMTCSVVLSWAAS
jgi:hypothetical protein